MPPANAGATGPLAPDPEGDHLSAGALRPLRDPETPELDDDEDGTG